MLLVPHAPYSKAILRTLLGCAFLLLSLSGCQGSDGFSTYENQLIMEENGIFGGTPVAKSSEIGSLIVALRFEGKDGDLQTCTGSWIAKNWILTAAHCLPESQDRLSVYQTLSLEDSITDLKSLEIVRTIPHPRAAAEKARLHREKKWDQGNRFDIALIEVNNEKDRQPKFELASTARPNLLVAGAESVLNLFVSGFGAESFDLLSGATTGSPLLQIASLQVVNKVENGIVRLEQKGDSGICVGDSGAPLFSTQKGEKKTKPILLAVASSVRNPGSSSVCRGESRFIQIAPHKAWIKKSLSLKPRDF